MIKVTERIKIPLKELVFSFSKSSGPGGQKVNKSNTRATLKWNLFQSKAVSQQIKNLLIDRLRMTPEGWLLISSDRYRNQGRNVADCLEKFKTHLQRASHRPKKRKKTKPTLQSKEKRLDEKKGRSKIKALRRKPDQS